MPAKTTRPVHPISPSSFNDRVRLNIERYRRELDLTQGELSARISSLGAAAISVEQFSKFASGRSRPSFYQAWCIANALGVALEDLLRSTEP